MAKAGNYYYDQLNKEQQRAYYAMKEGLLNLQDSFAVPMLYQKELSDIYFMIRILCDELNIWCIIALSEANPDKGIKYRHAWNVIKIGGQYYHLDATFDNTLSKDDTVRYDYVNLSDKQIFRDHEPVIWKVPACSDNDHFYYKEKKISRTTLDEVRKRTKQAVKKGKVLLFHWRGGYLTREILVQLFEIFDQEAQAKDKRACVSVNWPQAVLRVRFENGIGEEQIEMEKANEGEKN